MKEIKDKLSLAFWGLAGGAFLWGVFLVNHLPVITQDSLCCAFFVGCIFGIGAIINYVHSHTPLGLSKSIALILLAAVIVGALKIIEKLYKYFTRNPPTNYPQ